MKNATPIFLAVLLVVSLVAMPVIAVGPEPDDTTRDVSNVYLQQSTIQQGSSSPVEADDTTNRLRPPVVREEHAEYGSDLGLTLATMDDQLRADYEQYTLVDSDFHTATNDERKEMISTANDRIGERSDEIEAREREAVESHANGTISDGELIQTLLRNYNEAAVLLDALDELDERTDAVDGYSLSNPQVRADKAELELHRTDFRSNLNQISQSTGSDEPVNVRVQTSEDGYSLSMIDGDMYVLETARFDNRYTTAPNRFEDYSNSEVMQAATEYYPWAGGEQGWASFNDYGEEGLYYVEMENNNNKLEVYLDGGSGRVYREAQELSLESLPEDGTDSMSEDGLEVTLTETPVNGPVEVAVNDTEASESVSATVSIDGEEVGETDGDGALWFLPPIGEYELTIETDSKSVDATVEND